MVKVLTCLIPAFRHFSYPHLFTSSRQLQNGRELCNVSAILTEHLLPTACSNMSGSSYANAVSLNTSLYYVPSTSFFLSKYSICKINDFSVLQIALLWRRCFKALRLFIIVMVRLLIFSLNCFLYFMDLLY